MSAVIDPPRLLTAEEFAAMPGEECFTELVEGRVVRSPLRGSLHGFVCANIGYEIGKHVIGRSLGHVISNNCGVVTRRNPDSVRGPDLSYYSFKRIPKGSVLRGYPEVSPELVVEVMSPDDVFRDLMAKVDEYLAAGVLLVVVIDPDRQQAMLFRKGELGTLFGPADELVFPGVLPDLRIPVRPLFE